MRIPKLPKQRFISDRQRQVSLGKKNASPFEYGFPTATSIPGNEKGIVVPCAPFDDFDGDRRWCICESKEQAISLLNDYIREWQKQDEESRCVFYKKKADGTYYGVKCRKDCLHCPKLYDPEHPERLTWNYQRTGNPISLDFTYDDTDEEESEHEIADTTSETPAEYTERIHEEARIEALIKQRDELDQKIINLLLDDSTLSERDIMRKINVSRDTIHYRITRLKEWVKKL